MDDVSRVHLLLFRAIRALASPLMTIGMTAKELIEISKLAFVDAAIKKYSKGTHAASNTRVVQKTGLSKHEVRRLRAKLQETTTEPDLRPVPEGAVLHRWYTDPEFLDQSGRPKPLGKGSGRGTLVELIEKSEIGDVSQIGNGLCSHHDLLFGTDFCDRLCLLLGHFLDGAGHAQRRLYLAVGGACCLGCLQVNFQVGCAVDGQSRAN